VSAIALATPAPVPGSTPAAALGAEPATDLELVVDAVSTEADGVVAIGLAAPGGGDLPAWTPGAHIDLRLGNGMQRQYSLCSDPAERRRWRIAVLREPASRGGSAWLHSQLKPGDRIHSTGPRNHFPLVPAASYRFIAGGIGITPLLPMIRELAASGGAPWKLLYGGRTRRSMAFVDSLRAIEPGQDRVQVRPQDEFGLLDLRGWLGEPRSDVAVYCCGPEGLLEAVEAIFEGWPDGVLHVERFAPVPGALDGTVAGAGQFDVVLAKAGLSCRVGAGESIIDALDRAGFHVPRSCGEGTCGTCLTPVIEGTPDHRDSFLFGKKRAANNAMCVCCSRSLSPRLVLDL
jgi:ferredoxin-NADP reductase